MILSSSSKIKSSSFCFKDSTRYSICCACMWQRNMQARIYLPRKILGYPIISVTNYTYKKQRFCRLETNYVFMPIYLTVHNYRFCILYKCISALLLSCSLKIKKGTFGFLGTTRYSISYACILQSNILAGYDIYQLENSVTVLHALQSVAKCISLKLVFR